MSQTIYTIHGSPIHVRIATHRHMAYECTRCDFCPAYFPVGELSCFNIVNDDRTPKELHLCCVCYSNSRQNWGRG